jgi:hypothetical protein
MVITKLVVENKKKISKELKHTTRRLAMVADACNPHAWEVMPAWATH